MVYYVQVRKTRKVSEMYDTAEQQYFELEAFITAATNIMRRDYDRMMEDWNDVNVALYTESRKLVNSLCDQMNYTLQRMKG